MNKVDDVVKEVTDIILEIIKSAPDRNRVHLTWVGNQFSKQKKATFEKYINFLCIDKSVDIQTTKMLPFLEKYCATLLDIEKRADGQVLVRVNNKPEIPDPIEDTSPSNSAFESRRYKKGIFAAFIKPLDAINRRFIDLANSGFKDTSIDLSSEYVKEVQRKYIVSIGAEDKVDSEEVQKRIQSWAEYNGVKIESLLDAEQSEKKSSIADLLRIIESLPIEVIGKWNIPADVLVNLRRK